MSDQHLGDLLSGVLDRELSPAEEASAQLHLSSCGFCRAELEEVRAARTWIQALPPVEPPSGFYERLLQESRRRSSYASRPPSVRRRVGFAALAASAAAAMGLLGMAPPQEEPVSPSVARLVEAHATGASLEGDPVSRLAPLGVPVSFGR